MADAGKGDAPRPINVDRKVYESNWERVFGSKKRETDNDKTKDSV